MKCSNLCFIDHSQSMPSQIQGTCCTQKDFLEDVGAKIPTSWYLFGICLGIEDEKLKDIGQSHPNDKLRCFSEVYSIWKKKKQEPLTWEVVVKILRRDMMGQQVLSLSLAKKYNVQM